MMNQKASRPTLETVFATCERAAVACSGGVDSMTLAYAAHCTMGDRVTIYHAVSPAVPPDATERIRAYTEREAWNLVVLDAGEFDDENYMANPANRCFFCKSNLYSTLSKAAEGAQVFSGTNLDDLGDWRPGLKAAEDNAVRHPFVEANMSKMDVRTLATQFGLDDIAEMPSAPCLSSRMETGLRINSDALRAIDRAETLLRNRLHADTIRCRVRHVGIVIELDAATCETLSKAQQTELTREINLLFSHAPDARVSFEPYSRGSAFLRETLA